MQKAALAWVWYIANILGYCILCTIHHWVDKIPIYICVQDTHYKIEAGLDDFAFYTLIRVFLACL